MYPEIEPYASGRLDVGDGHQIYWECCGNPDGRPALAVHGGPGSGCVPGMRQPFDPDVYRLVLFDQRGCGRSTPHVSDPTVDLGTNTTHHLIADMELLREHLGVPAWLVVGWSWGTTLALAYAERHPDRVTGLALTAVTVTGPRDVEWITRDVGRLFPAAWARFRDGLPDADRDANIADGYARLLASDDPHVREQAARDWCDWEASHVDVDGSRPPPARYADPRYRMCFALGYSLLAPRRVAAGGRTAARRHPNRPSASGSHPRSTRSELPARHRMAIGREVAGRTPARRPRRRTHLRWCDVRPPRRILGPIPADVAEPHRLTT